MLSTVSLDWTSFVLKTVHVWSSLFWVGGLFWLPISSVGRPSWPICWGVMGWMSLSIGTGIARLVSLYSWPEALQSGWLHAKITAVFLLVLATIWILRGGCLSPWRRFAAALLTMFLSFSVFFAIYALKPLSQAQRHAEERVAHQVLCSTRDPSSL